MEESLLNGAPEAKERTIDLKGRVWLESKELWKVAFPTMINRVSSYGMYVVTQAFMGHIGASELAAYAYVQIITMRFVNGIVLGMSSATETLCGQAFGAMQYHMLGIYLQRSWIVNIVTVTLFLPIFLYATPIFEFVGLDQDVAEIAGTMSLWFIPVAYYLVFSLTIQQYLQAQRKNMICGWLSIASFLLHVLLSWISVSKLSLGLPGAMGALIISSYFMLFGEVVYVFGGGCPNTWLGFTKAAFKDIFPVVKLSISSGVMICLEYWYNAVLILMAAYMKNATVAVSALSICINIVSWEYMVSLGFLAAACVRVSNELGKGNAKVAKFSVKVISGTSLCIGMFFTILFLVFGNDIAYVFTSDEEVAESISSLSVLLALSVFLNSIQPVLSGVAVGASWQGLVAFVNIGCYYIIGVPIGLLLGYVANLGVQGIWIGMMSGKVTQTLVLIFITWRTNWEAQVNKAEDRLNKWLLKPTEESNQNSIQV